MLNALIARRPEILGVGEGGLRSGVVHRLDVETSGALIVATEASAWGRLRGAFADHRVEKRYQALVSGDFAEPRHVALPLVVSRHRPARVAVDPAGRPCRQFVRPLERLDGVTLVEIELETGFLHQIRASLAHLGHPLLGDPAYGGPSSRGGAKIARVMLHARRVAWADIDASVEPPADFRAVLAALGAVRA